MRVDSYAPFLDGAEQLHWHAECILTVVEHELTIAYGALPNQEPLNDYVRVMAEMNVRSFEDDGYQPSMTGKLLAMPDSLLRRIRSGGFVSVEIGGVAYRFSRLDADGTFELRRDQNTVAS